MANRTQLPIRLDELNGLYYRGIRDRVPLDHFRDCLNIDYDGEGWVTRSGCSLELTDATNGVNFAFPYVINTERYYLYLDGNSVLRSSRDSSVALKTFASSGGNVVTSFSAIKVYGRIYISPRTVDSGWFSPGTSDGNIYVVILNRVASVTIPAAGSGYAVGDILTLVGGDYNAKVSVSTIGGSGEITAVAIIHPGSSYTVGTKITTTTGAGISATINVATISDVAYLAAGDPPSGFTLTVAVSATAGNIETGRRLFAVAFETESGFITVPGPVAWSLFNQTTANRKIDISVIPTGPAGTIARHILASRVIFNYNSKKFNQLEHELFFIPGGKIENNTDTTLTVNFYDSELTSSADYLIDQLSAIPAGLKLAFYNGRLASCSEFTSPYTTRVSKAGAVESFDSVSGFITTPPDDTMFAGINALSGRYIGVRSIGVFRGNFLVMKNTKTYAYQDNGGDPSEWPSTLVDGAIGVITPDGIGQVLDSNSPNQDVLLTVGYSGIRLFNGQYDEIPLTYKIDTLWNLFVSGESEGLIGAGNSGARLYIDGIDKKIYVNVTGTAESLILVGDYSSGLNYQSIKWYLWKFPFPADDIFLGLNPTTNIFNRLYFINDQKLYKVNDNSTSDQIISANDTAINSFIETGEVFPGESDGSMDTFNIVKCRVLGSGTLSITITTMDRVSNSTPTGLTLSSAPGKLLPRLTNIQNERVSYKFGTNAIGSRFKFYGTWVSSIITSGERPA